MNSLVVLRDRRFSLLLAARTISVLGSAFAPAALSRVASYDALGSFLFGPLGLLVAGPLVSLIGAGRAMLACAAALVVVGMAPLVSAGVRTLEWSHDAA